MNLSKDQLDMIEKMAGNFFTIKETAIVIQVPLHELKKMIADEKSEAYQRYYKGKYTTELELRESIIKMAKRGSNPAQKMLLELLSSMNVGNI